MTIGTDQLYWRHQVHACVRNAIAEWNDRAKIMHAGHIIDLAAILAEAIAHPNSIVSQRIRDGEQQDGGKNG